MHRDDEVHSQVCATLERFSKLVSTWDPRVLEEFAQEDDILLAGSETGEVVIGGQEVEAFFRRIFARAEYYSWEWDHIETSHTGDVAWFLADGRVILSTGDDQRRLPYKISGVLERHGQLWRWRQYHGSEPVRDD